MMLARLTYTFVEGISQGSCQGRRDEEKEGGGQES